MKGFNMSELFSTTDDELYKRKKIKNFVTRKTFLNTSTQSHDNTCLPIHEHRIQICLECKTYDESNKNTKKLARNKNKIRSKTHIFNYLNTVLFIITSIFCAVAFMIVISPPYNIIFAALVVSPLAVSVYRMVCRYNEKL